MFGTMNSENAVFFLFSQSEHTKFKPFDNAISFWKVGLGIGFFEVR